MAPQWLFMDDFKSPLDVDDLCSWVFRQKFGVCARIELSKLESYVIWKKKWWESSASFSLSFPLADSPALSMAMKEEARIGESLSSKFEIEERERKRQTLSINQRLPIIPRLLEHHETRNIFSHEFSKESLLHHQNITFIHKHFGTGQ